MALVASSGLAHGDAFVTGSVSNQDLNGVACSRSASSSTTLALSCGSTTPFSEGFASLTANVADTAGSMRAFLTSFEDSTHPGPTTLSLASFSLSVQGTYMLTGGIGYGNVDWSINSFRHGEGGGGLFGPCTVTLAGVSEFCDLNSGLASGSFYVPYDTPLQLNFVSSFNAGASDNDGVNSGMDYTLGSLVAVPPVPEPAPFALVGIGLLCLARKTMFANSTAQA